MGEELNYVALASRQLEKFETLVPSFEHLFPYWLRDRLAVIQTVSTEATRTYKN